MTQTIQLSSKRGRMEVRSFKSELGGFKATLVDNTGGLMNRSHEVVRPTKFEAINEAVKLGVDILSHNSVIGGKPLVVRIDGMKCSKCDSILDDENNLDCVDCGKLFCDNCYDTSRGDGCHCHTN